MSRSLSGTRSCIISMSSKTLKAKGARFVDEIDEIPQGAVTIFSAHGVSKTVQTAAKSRKLPVIDATCPLVTKVHLQGKKYLSQGRTIILVGHAGHPEVEGTMGQIPGPVHLVQTEEDVNVASARLTIPPSPTSLRQRSASTIHAGSSMR